MSNHPIEMPHAVVTSQAPVICHVKPPSTPRAGVLLIVFTVLVALLHGLLIWALVAQRHDPSYAVGQVFGGTLLAPLLFVALFQLHPRFRNSRSMFKIFFWTTVCSIVSMVSKFAPAVAV